MEYRCCGTSTFGRVKIQNGCNIPTTDQIQICIRLGGDFISIRGHDGMDGMCHVQCRRPGEKTSGERRDTKTQWRPRLLPTWNMAVLPQQQAGTHGRKQREMNHHSTALARLQQHGTSTNTIVARYQPQPIKNC